MYIVYFLGRVITASQPSECGQQRTLNIVDAQTAAQQQLNKSYGARMFGKCGEEEHCAATQPFIHCCNQSGGRIPRIYHTHRG